MAEQTKEASGPSTSPGLRGASKNPVPGDVAAAGSVAVHHVGALSLPSSDGGGFAAEDGDP